MSQSNTAQYYGFLDGLLNKIRSQVRLLGWHTRPKRRLTVVFVLVGLVLYFAGSFIHPVLTLLGLILYFIAVFALKLVTRGMADSPAFVLDERELIVRNSAYVNAYRFIGGLIALTATIVVSIHALGSREVSMEFLQQFFFYIVVDGDCSAFLCGRLV